MYAIRSYYDAEFDVLPLGREAPLLRRGQVLLAEGVGARLSGEQAAAVDPRPEIGGDGDVGRGGVITSYSIHYTKLYDAQGWENNG